MEVPRCPRHRRSEVSRYGWYGRPGQRRQRWLCRPRSGTPHTFTEVLPRIAHSTVDGHTCRECRTRLEPWEGQPAPRLYGFTARHVAHALVRVSQGATYRSVATEVRAMAGRGLDTSRGRRGKDRKVLAPATAHAQLVSDWVSVFAPVIWNAYCDPSGLPWLQVDDLELRYSSDGHPRGLRAFVVLAAYGSGPGVAGRMVAVEAVPTATQRAWSRFLRRLPQPDLVVGDGGTPLAAAGRVWPVDVELRRCEWHWRRNILDALPAEIRADPTDAITAALPGAFSSLERWNALRVAIAVRHHTPREPGQPTYATAARVVDRLDPQVRDALLTRATDVGPRSTGPLEQCLTVMRSQLGDRCHAMTNKHRADALLKLLAANQNRWTDEYAWTEIITNNLERRKGRPVEQRKHVDPRAAPSLRS